jgi:putative membrane protein
VEAPIGAQVIAMSADEVQVAQTSATQSAADDEVFDPRIPFAAERTLLAWIRTGLAMMGFGFVVARFGLFLREIAATHLGVNIPLPTPPERHIRFSLWAGTVLVAMGVLVCAAAAVQHIRFLGRFRRGQPWRVSRTSLGIVVAFLLAGLGVAMAAYLIVMR